VADPVISIVSASVDSPEGGALLVKSIRKYATLEYETIIIDNGSGLINLRWLHQESRAGRIRLIENRYNAGHGGAMDQGTREARGRFVCFIDIDAHFQRQAWDADLVALYESDPKTRMIGVIGPEHKPYHPPLFFYECEFILSNRLTFVYQPGVAHSTDTAQKVYWDIIDLGFRSERLAKGPKVYADCIGDEIVINGVPTIYHNWQGTRFLENRPGKEKATLDGIKLDDHLALKARLFARPEVKAILAEP